ncbi:MAG: hypothetical protein AAGF60_05685 [Pseudomonadota bacterium]
MDIIFHIGAHRTATTSFQACARANAALLARAGLAVWEPRMLRRGLLDGLGTDRALRARGRVQFRLARAARDGTRQVVVSEENMLGSVRANIRARSLYPDAGARMARYAAVVDNAVRCVVLTVRALDLYWASALAYGVGRGHSVPGPDARDALAAAPRTWRDVITDVAKALPQAELIVVPFERIAGRPRQLLRAATGQHLPLSGADIWCNRAPDVADLTEHLAARGSAHVLQTEGGRWQPFSPLQAGLLREAYVDDMAWLSAGADGLATLWEETRPETNGDTPAWAFRRGQGYDQRTRRLA